MSKINLAAALVMKNSVGNINAIKGIGFSWSKSISGIADYYGIGPGQIVGDWRVDDPIYWPSTSYMQTARNDGGAGALIELTGRESSRQTLISGDEGAKNTPLRSGEQPDRPHSHQTLQMVLASIRWLSRSSGLLIMLWHNQAMSVQAL